MKLEMNMRRILIVTVCVYFSALVFANQAAPMAKKGGNPDAAKVQNPVASNPESIAQGRRVYQRLCSRCHGPQGKGDGGGGGGAQPADLTDDQWDYGPSDGEIFSAIHDGTSIDMEGYASRISDTDIWNLVNYVRSIGPARK
jgi:cytochrome c oxidase cbb3-type subunit III